MNDLPIACNPFAMTDEQRAAHPRLLEEISRAALRFDEDDEGFVVTYPADPSVAERVARWTVLERACCPFLAFDLCVHDDAQISLRVRAAGEARDLVRALFTR